MPEGVKQNKNGTEMDHYNGAQPQSSSAFNTVRQGNHGLGYSLLAIVHRMKMIKQMSAKVAGIVVGVAGFMCSIAVAGAPNFWDEIPLSPSTKMPVEVKDEYWNEEIARVNREVSLADKTRLVFSEIQSRGAGRWESTRVRKSGMRTIPNINR